ncbi:hypothetical protein SO694_00018485 [Aureococcus anophagefferens]|uniref:Uncharacterized protein n=1 Tax=Aureococcus anophagefferens TaxID=44056 RepID=A0ABR1G0N4_AURAN
MAALKGFESHVVFHRFCFFAAGSGAEAMMRSSADFAADSDAEDGAEETINGDFGPQKGIANMAAFDAEIMRDFLVDVDKIFYDFASHRAEDVPDTSIRTVADAYFVRYLGMMRERQTALHKLLARTPLLVYGSTSSTAERSEIQIFSKAFSSVLSTERGPEGVSKTS